MQALPECQAIIANALLDPAAPTPTGLSSHTSLIVTRRFNVYRNNVVVSLIEALKATFPVACRLVGDEFFAATAREFVRTSPPGSPILSRYGEEFPNFLAQFEPVSDIPYLPDVARLEWLQLRAYHAPDASSLDAGDFAHLDPSSIPNLVVSLLPSVRLFSSPFACVSIWRTNTHDQEVKPIEDLHRGEDALVLRPGQEVIVLPLPVGAHQFISELAARNSLGSAYASVSVKEPAFDLQFALAALIDCGAITSFGFERIEPHDTEREYRE